MNRLQDRPLGHVVQRPLASVVTTITAVLMLSPACTPGSAPQPAGAIASPSPLTSPSLIASPAPPTSLLSAKYSATYDFVSPSLGWALVALRSVLSLPEPSPNFWVFRTTDGAQHWQQQMAGTAPGFYLGGVQLFDATHGLLDVNGLQSLLYRTDDGGGHWSLVPMPSNTVEYSFGDPLRGWAYAWLNLNQAGDHPHLLSTVDGGQSWTERPPMPADAIWPGNGKPGEAHFRASGEGWMGSNLLRPTVFSTFDGGTTWQADVLAVAPGVFPTPSPDDPTFYVDTVVLPRAGVLAVVTGGFGRQRGFTSFDRGATWRLIAPLPAGMTFADVLYVDATHWWSMGSGLLNKTSDAGQTWKEVPAAEPLGNWIYSPHVIDAGDAWAQLTGALTNPADSSLVLSSDGGVSWTPVNVPQP